MANEYADLAELKALLRIDPDVTKDDAMLQARITRASRAIDTRCGNRQFWLDSAATARTFRTRGRVVSSFDGDLLLVDDIGSLTDLAVQTGDGTTWTTVAGHETEPENALAKGRAVTGLRLAAGTRWSATRARITARWGWPAVPDNIREATLLLANRRYKRKDSPEGVAAWAQEGTIRVSRFDPDIEDLIQDYVLDGFGS